MLYTPDGRDDAFNIIVHQNVRLSEVIVTDILESDRLPVIFSTLGPVRTRTILDPVENLTDWELFQSFALELISPDIKIHSSNEADEAARDFAASVASAYRLSTRTTTILDSKFAMPRLDHLLKHKGKLLVLVFNIKGGT
jgi:hypothetical protein